MAKKDAGGADPAGAGSEHEGLSVDLSENVVLVAKELWKRDDGDA